MFFPIISLWQIMTPPGRVAYLDPRGMVGRFIKVFFKHGYTQYIKAVGLMVLEKKIFLCFNAVNPPNQ